MVAKKEIVKHTESAAMKLTPETVKAYVNQYATDQEVALFLNQCVMFGLNPFKREIYLIKYSAKDAATFVVGYEVYLKRAERSSKWGGMESGTEGEGDNMKAWAKVYRKDWEKPLYHEVDLAEYIQFKDEWKDGNKTGQKIPTKFWANKPKTMLKKVAICQAFRMAFPDEFAGMPYASEEMPVDHEKLPMTEIKIESTATPPPAEKKEYAQPTDQYPDEFNSSPATKEQLSAIHDGIEALRKLKISDTTIWKGIAGENMKKHGREIVDSEGLSDIEAKTIVEYLGLWCEHIIKNLEEKKAAKKAEARA